MNATGSYAFHTTGAKSHIECVNALLSHRMGLGIRAIMFCLSGLLLRFLDAEQHQRKAELIGVHDGSVTPLAAQCLTLCYHC